jgi:predicted nucleotidyltransferase
VEAHYLLKGIADSFGIAFFVVGAFSRDLILKHGYGIEPRRKTGDIDLGVEVAN